MSQASLSGRDAREAAVTKEGLTSDSATGGLAGRVEVSPQAIATVARTAVLTCYGVVGLFTGGRGQSILARLSRGEAPSGIEVRVQDETVAINVHVVIEYGLRISEVARNIMQSVSFAVEQALGTPVAEVNVYIDDLHLPAES